MSCITPAAKGDFLLFLASRSPRRHDLLRDIGVPFQVVTSTGEEVLTGDSPIAIAEANALAKLQGAVLPEEMSGDIKQARESFLSEDAFILAADTIVVTREQNYNKILGKASSATEAEQMLYMLSGHTHEVITGLALAAGLAKGSTRGEQSLASVEGVETTICVPIVRSAVTKVSFSPLSKADIAAYVASGEWEGKAGAYAIQGLAALFVSGIQGEYSNVVGLPLHLLYRMFSELGFNLLQLLCEAQ